MNWDYLELNKPVDARALVHGRFLFDLIKLSELSKSGLARFDVFQVTTHSYP